ncbi:MAG: hypothetical protein ACLFVU_00640 [Phycisphaerae bacterium]
MRSLLEKLMKSVLIGMFAVGATAVLPACDDDDPIEETGEDIEEGAEDVEDEMEEEL